MLSASSGAVENVMASRFAIAFALLSAAAPSVNAGVILTSFDVGSSEVSGPTSSDLFVHLGSAGSGDSAAIAMVWPATVNLALLATLPSSLTVNLPDRTAVVLYRGRAERRGPEGFVWNGRGGDCSAVFTVDSNKIHATLSCINANYSIEGSNAGGLQLTRYDQSQLPGEATPVAMPSLLPTISPIAMREVAVDSVIDVLVLYTEGVRQFYDPTGGAAGTRLFAQSAVDQVQLAFDNSNVGTGIALTKAKWVARSDSSNLSLLLDYLAADPTPTALRDFWAADVVILVTEVGASPITCGIANTPGMGGAPPPGTSFAPNALGVVARSCAIADFSFSHELAHLIGANHNPESNSNATPLRAWALGHWQTNIEGGARTIMSYPLSPSLCTSPCSRILNFSNADIWVDWFRTGRPDQRENARVLNEFAPVTAQYRLSLGRIFADDFSL
ncbi:M12 family metallo-peptidase [Tahibacter harae]|uniref:Zinc-dependent metalloprotease n=1 Tax=Tahibacter harae TaxID=2963937 RepID=A0ABT1QZJ8_9GAMM|nr:M12 family metallo-peptidase [Tahibacter harae]MCQ4167714.1 zinc-dependent metalloprotease [Tahibacter harae]